MYYLSALVAIIGAVGYQYYVKRVPTSINPVVSVLVQYVAVLVFGFGLLLFFRPEGGLRAQLQQITWVQVALAVTVLLIELGFLMMYRSGWNLSTGNVITGVVVNIVLVGLGVGLLGEKVTVVNAIGIALSILGVALISYRS